MRKLSFTPPDTEAWKNWRKSCGRARKKTLEAIARGERPKISEAYKKQRSTYFAAQGPFRGKCAYCEQIIVADQHGDVEHYRPKAGVEELDGTRVTKTEHGVTVEHPGYYWLAYEWENLLPSCVLCNQIPAGNEYGKGVRFPVRANRAWAPGEEMQEQPELLNPLVDNPAEHLEFDVDTGILVPLTMRGEITIRVLGLNLRELPHYRLQAFKDARGRYCLALGRGLAEGSQGVIGELADLRADESREFISIIKRAYKMVAAEVLEAAAPDGVEVVGG